MDLSKDSAPRKLYIGSPKELQEVMHELIPISSSMGVVVSEYKKDTLTLTAPLNKNINHQQSAFGGSISALAALAGWGILQLKLSELDLDCNTVVADAHIKFLKPIREDLVCEAKLHRTHTQLLRGIKNNGSAIVELDTKFFAGGIKAMTSHSIYHIKNRGI